MQTRSERTAADVRAAIEAEQAKQERFREEREPKAAELEAAQQGTSVPVEELVELETTVASQDRLLEASERRLAALRQELEEAEEREDRVTSRAEVVALAAQATDAEESYSDALEEAVSALTKRVDRLVERFEEWQKLHRAGYAEAEDLLGGRGVPGLLRELSGDGHEVRGLQSKPNRAVSLMDRDPMEVVILRLIRTELNRKAKARLTYR